MEMLCIDFLNSDWHHYLGTGRSEDRLTKKEWVEALLKRWGFEGVQAMDEKVYNELVQLRSLLQRMIQATARGEQLKAEEREALDGYLQESVVRRRLVERDGQIKIVLEPVEKNWCWVEAEIAASFVEAILTGEVERIRQCENPDCLWVYYDESKNRSRRWCDEDCGTLIKVRRFRAKQRSRAGS